MHNPKFDDFAIWNPLKCIQKKPSKYKKLNWSLMLEPFTLSKLNLVQACSDGTWAKQQCNAIFSCNVWNTKLKMHWNLELNAPDGSRDTLIFQFALHLHSKSTKNRTMNINALGTNAQNEDEIFRSSNLQNPDLSYWVPLHFRILSSFA
jgi:hypothetical protein